MFLEVNQHRIFTSSFYQKEMRRNPRFFFLRDKYRIWIQPSLKKHPQAIGYLFGRKWYKNAFFHPVEEHYAM